MPYPSGHRDEVRENIIRSARKLFNRSGFDNVSVNQIIADAGLTRGGFYSYFKSKSSLYAEVLGCFFTDPNWKSNWDGIEIDVKAPQIAPQIVRAYLSRQHFNDVENSCPMVALPTDVARSGKALGGDHGPGNLGFVHGRDGGRQSDRGSRLGRRAARGFNRRGTQTGRMGRFSGRAGLTTA